MNSLKQVNEENPNDTENKFLSNKINNKQSEAQNNVQDMLFKDLLDSPLQSPSSMDPSISLETSSTMNPSNSSMATITSKNISTSEDSLSASDRLELINMLEKTSVKVDAMTPMTVKLKDTTKELKHE